VTITDKIDSSGKIQIKGTLKVPAGSGRMTMSGGILYIGEKGFTWNETYDRYICFNNEHELDLKTMTCTHCSSRISQEETPSAVFTMSNKIAGLVPNAVYIITVDENFNEYTADESGVIEILDNWFGKTINIVKKAIDGKTNTDSDPFSLSIPARYTVTYTDGAANGSAFAPKTYTVIDGNATPEFEGIPTWKGYKFIGWNTEIAETVTGDVTYEAQWEKLDSESEKKDVFVEIEKKTSLKINPSVLATRLLKINCYGSGEANLMSKVFVQSGETVTINLTPNEGYKIEKITVNGKVVDVSDSIDVKVIANTVINIVFAK